MITCDRCGKKDSITLIVTRRNIECRTNGGVCSLCTYDLCNDCWTTVRDAMIDAVHKVFTSPIGDKKE